VTVATGPPAVLAVRGLPTSCTAPYCEDEAVPRPPNRGRPADSGRESAAVDTTVCSWADGALIWPLSADMGRDRAAALADWGLLPALLPGAVVLPDLWRVPAAILITSMAGSRMSITRGSGEGTHPVPT
jgi:hypothetical protein